MRRDHRPAFLELDPPVDNFSLLLRAEKDRARWRASGLPTPPHTNPSRQSSDHSSSTSNAKTDGVAGSSPGEEDQEPGPDFPGRVDGYRRIMRAHTLNQLQSPTGGTVPSYRRTMHAFTLRQLNHYQPSSKRAACSPVSGAKQAQLSPRSNGSVVGLTRDEFPRAPSNTPDFKQSCAWSRRAVSDVHGIDFRKLKRSVTEPQGGSCLLLNRARDVVVA